VRLLRALPLRHEAVRAAQPAALGAGDAPRQPLLAPPRLRRRPRAGQAPPRRAHDGGRRAVMLEVRDLRKYFRLEHGRVLRAVDGVSLSIRENEVVGLVGESGCGKSTLGRAIVGLHEKTSGEVRFRGEVLPARYTTDDFRRYARKIHMIFQDP